MSRKSLIYDESSLNIEDADSVTPISSSDDENEKWLKLMQDEEAWAI